MTAVLSDSGETVLVLDEGEYRPFPIQWEDTGSARRVRDYLEDLFREALRS
jgi:hypothetical protein